MKLSKKIVLEFLVLLLFIVLAEVSPVAAKKNPYLNVVKIKMKIGSKYMLKLKNNKKKIKWSSSKKKIVSVNKSGVIKAIKAGKAVITAKAGKVKCNCKVIVVKQKKINVTSAPVIPTEEPQNSVITKITSKPYSIQATEDDKQLSVRGIVLSFGESSESVIQKLGNPSRIDDTEYNDILMVYNDDYSNLLMVEISQNKVVGWYTDAAYFSYCGISRASDINAINTAFKTNLEYRKNISILHPDVRINIFMDGLNGQTVDGIYVRDKNSSVNDVSNVVLASWDKELLDMTNSYRAKNGLSPLLWSNEAAAAAQLHSVYMANNGFISHEGANNSDPSDRMVAAGIQEYNFMGENVAYGKDYPMYNATFLNNAWINSQGHRANILSTQFTHFGAGCSIIDGFVYSTQDFFGVR